DCPQDWRITAGVKTLHLQPGDPDLPVEMPEGTYARVSVTDTGTGIDPAIQNRLFEPFFTTKQEGSGTGLGLASVYGIVVAHSGWIAVNSELGVGTTFEFHLPVSVAPSRPAVRTPAWEEAPRGTE